MNFEIIKELEKEQLKAEVPQFATGDTVRVHNRIKEGTRERDHFHRQENLQRHRRREDMAHPLP